ncbi:MAG: aldehyde dehydrogenase family protein [Candidatus Thermoplasmatota archaeon]|jgi:aldehyde dehydrogenase (NAD+)|nr:aldehyde dehydrogenase family protein [Candidatus Thermoplasmatota archaeon]
MVSENFLRLKESVFDELGIKKSNSGIFVSKWIPLEDHETIESRSPINGEVLSTVSVANRKDYDQMMSFSEKVFDEWREIPAPKRGEIIMSVGKAIQNKKKALGAMVTLEAGKIRSEGEGEIQEMIDVSYFATGISRQLYGLTMASERPDHMLFEQWNPLGTVGVISSFNFPASVWSWNAFIAAVAGDNVVWKPSSKACLTAIAVMRVVSEALSDAGSPPIFSLLVSRGSDGGEWISRDPRIPLVSFTGSTEVGRNLYGKVASRLGRVILELGGNNGVIVSEKCDLDLAIKGISFGSLGTAGQRCTTTRRAIVHEKIYDEFISKLKRVYSSVKVGDPSSDDVMVGPLIDKTAEKNFLNAVEKASSEGGAVVYGGTRADIPGLENGNYVVPAIIEANENMEIVKKETFAPILYVIKYRDFDEALRIHNSVPQGLSSAIFTNDINEEGRFLSPHGSDCGLVNINTSTSGAEIGGAFGGEKETGLGRESGSDSWKYYMRRQTVTRNYGRTIPLSQGVVFNAGES